MVRVRGKRVMLVLWVVAGLAFPLFWLVGIGWVGVTWALTTWTYVALPLYAATIAMTYSSSMLHVGRTLVVIGIWAFLLVIGNLHPMLLGGREAPLFHSIGVALSIVGSLFPIAVIATSVSRLRRMPNEEQLGPVFSLILLGGLAAGAGFTAYKEFRHQPRLVIYLRAGATAREVNEIWVHTLSRPVGRDEHVLLDGISGITATQQAGRTTLLLNFESRATGADRKRIRELLGRSAVVERVVEE